MKKYFDEQLVAAYPKIFANRFGSMSETAMCWGFDCGDGWFSILDSLCHAIQSHIDQSIKSREWTINFNAELESAKANNWENWKDGWTRTVRPVPNPVPQVIATQVKEKYGTLRFYYDGGDDYIRGLVSMAERMTAITCEVCGNAGKVNDEGWITVRCDEHSKAN